MWFLKQLFRGNETKVEKPDLDLVWNEAGVLLSTRDANGERKFEDFSGHVRLYGERCEVEHASFTYHVGNMSYIKGTARPPRPFDVRCNRITEFRGTVRSGSLRCDRLVNGIVGEALVFCKVAEGCTMNGGKVVCGTWERGTVNGGELKCGEWRCGTMNGGVCSCETWRDGYFNGGTFLGDWCGGKWHGGEFQGKSSVGDGSFAAIEKV